MAPCNMKIPYLSLQVAQVRSSIRHSDGITCRKIGYRRNIIGAISRRSGRGRRRNINNLRVAFALFFGGGGDGGAFGVLLAFLLGGDSKETSLRGAFLFEFRDVFLESFNFVRVRRSGGSGGHAKKAQKRRVDVSLRVA